MDLFFSTALATAESLNFGHFILIVKLFKSLAVGRPAEGKKEED